MRMNEEEKSEDDGIRKRLDKNYFTCILSDTNNVKSDKEDVDDNEIKRKDKDRNYDNK